MNRSLKIKVAAGVAGGIAAAGAGGAIAATQLGSPKSENEAIVKDAADRLGVQPSELSTALKKALEDRVDAAVAAGRLTEQEGEAIKEHIESDEAPLFAGPPPDRATFGLFGRRGDPAAKYLGLTQSELRSQLRSGKTLAEIARARGKSVDGLVQALVDAARKHLDDAVSAGRLSAAQEREILSDLKEHTKELVNGRMHLEVHGPMRPGPHFGIGGPPQRHSLPG